MQPARTVSFTRHAANLFFHILTRCNLSCRHCYINPDQHGRRTLPIDTIGQWLRLLLADRPAANVIFLGGEPTLHPDLALAVAAARDCGAQSVTIDTNGYLFHDILQRVTPDQVDNISFSLDGATAETNDCLRGKGSYTQCLRGLKQAVARGFTTSLIYTINRQNIHEIDQMADLAADLGITRFFFQVIGLRGHSAGAAADDLHIDRHMWLEHVPAAAQAIAARGITAIYPKVFLDPEDSFECAGTVADNLFVFPNGRIYRCPLCEDFALHSMQIDSKRIVQRPPLTETDLFGLNIPEGCVMNKLIQPANIEYDRHGHPRDRIACCMLKQQIDPACA